MMASNTIMRHGSLFSGIGGFDLAAEWMGWENVFHCEWNQFGQKILKHYWPNAISYGDITKTDFNVHRGQIDIVTGGFPCQPYSNAGKRKGKEDERHLWPEMLRAIREVQPGYVVGENVGGLVSWNGGMVFNEVQTDLEAEGYEVLPFLLPACSVNAPHRRDRIWFIAHANCFRQLRPAVCKEQPRGTEAISTSENGVIAYSRLQRSQKCEKQAAGIEQRDKRDATNTQGIGERKQTNETNAITESRETRPEFSGCSEQYFANTEKPYQQRYWICEECKGLPAGRCNCGKKWFDNFPTQSPVCSRNDGLSTKLDGITFSKWRNESLKGYGNAIVPQLALQIFKAIEQMEKAE